MRPALGIAQAPQDAFTVFNFFKPGFMPSGEMSASGLLGPEFQLQTDSVIALTTNTFRSFYISFDLNDEIINILRTECMKG